MARLPGSPRPMAELALFLALSQKLTGVPTLGAEVARRHIETLRRVAGAAAVAAMLQRFGESVQGAGDPAAALQTLMEGDATFAALARALLGLWYTGLTREPGKEPVFSHPEDYFDALMWAAVGAHPPASSDGYFGHWRIPPDSGS